MSDISFTPPVTPDETAPEETAPPAGLPAEQPEEQPGEESFDPPTALLNMFADAFPGIDQIGAPLGEKLFARIDAIEASLATMIERLEALTAALNTVGAQQQATVDMVDGFVRKMSVGNPVEMIRQLMGGGKRGGSNTPGPNS